jgi:hypothetical protein
MQHFSTRTKAVTTWHRYFPEHLKHFLCDLHKSDTSIWQKVGRNKYGIRIYRIPSYVLISRFHCFSTVWKPFGIQKPATMMLCAFADWNKHWELLFIACNNINNNSNLSAESLDRISAMCLLTPRFLQCACIRCINPKFHTFNEILILNSILRI